MQHAVSLLFDVEDLCWPGSDDIALDVATRLTQHQVEASFFVVGEKARLFAQRQRDDAIAALLQHEVASHTTSHSLHPTVAEYLACSDWDEGVYRVWDDEERGAEMLREVFGLSMRSWGQAGGSWGPQLHQGLLRAGFESIVYPLTRTQDPGDVHWYAGMRVFPGDDMPFFDDELADDTAFEKAMQRLDDTLSRRINLGLRWSGVFVCHPTRLRAVEFWDALNFARGVHTAPADYRLPTLRSDEAYQTALRNLDHLLTWLKRNPFLDLQPISALETRFPPPDSTVYLMEIDEAVDYYQDHDDIPPIFYQFSPAELLEMMARIFTDPDSYPETIVRRFVLGPTEEPVYEEPTHGFVYWDDFLAACRQISLQVANQGRLPASLTMRGSNWHIGSFFRAALNVWPAFRRGTPPPSLDWNPAPMFPEIGHRIAADVQEHYEGWPIHNLDIDLNTLLRHTCFQAWTLRPAYPR